MKDRIRRSLRKTDTGSKQRAGRGEIVDDPDLSAEARRMLAEESTEDEKEN